MINIQNTDTKILIALSNWHSAGFDKPVVIDDERAWGVLINEINGCLITERECGVGTDVTEVKAGDRIPMIDGTYEVLGVDDEDHFMLLQKDESRLLVPGRGRFFTKKFYLEKT